MEVKAVEELRRVRQRQHASRKQKQLHERFITTENISIAYRANQEKGGNIKLEYLFEKQLLRSRSGISICTVYLDFLKGSYQDANQVWTEWGKLEEK